ncbi:alpha/beta fold hydrolase [Klebsiella variicola]
MRKNNTAIIFGGLFFSCSVMAANGTLAPTVVPMVNGGQASIAISNTSPNLFTVPGDRIIAVNSLDGALTNNEQTASGGVVVVPAMQTEDIISVINWAEKQECIDNQRIGLWGTSLGGGHVFSAAAQDQRVKCIVSQLAFADGDVLVTGEMNESERASFLSTLNKMAEKKKNTGKEMFVGVTRVLSDNESKVFFEKVKGQYPEMDIKIPFLTVMETLQYKPAESAAKVQCPVLIVIAGQDSVNPPEQGKALYDAVASGTKELYEEADACHYDIYEGAFFERVAAVQTQWFKKHL